MDAAIVDLARHALADVVAQSRIVTRVAVTVRTNTFYTRTKIRKLDEPSVAGEVITAAALRVLDLSNSTVRYDCSGCAWNWPPPA